jgi:hypothetical protein
VWKVRPTDSTFCCQLSRGVRGMRCIILLLLLFPGSAAAVAAAAAGVAAAFGEGAAEAAATGVAPAWSRGVGATADLGAEAVAAPSAVVEAVRVKRDEAPVSVGALLFSGLVLAEGVIDDIIVLVDAALNLGAAAAGEERECGGGKKWGGDLG